VIVTSQQGPLPLTGLVSNTFLNSSIKRRLCCGKSKISKRRAYSRHRKNNNLKAENVVINLSEHPLNINEREVLNKSLGFVSSQFKPTFHVINNDLLHFERKLQLHYYFTKKKHLNSQNSNDGTYVSESNVKRILECNSTWCLVPGAWWPRSLDPNITNFCYDIKEDIYSILTKRKAKNNLIGLEIGALISLKSNDDIISKRADEGGGIAVLDKRTYVPKISNVLNDANSYKLTHVDDTIKVKKEADSLIFQLENAGYISDKQCKYPTTFKPGSPTFFGLPQLHKVDWPLRPIVSRINGPTCRLNELVDKYLITAEHNIPYLLQDTIAYLQLIEKFSDTGTNCFLVAMDVTSLYTTIPHEEGANWVASHCEYTLFDWNRHSAGLIPIDRQTMFDLILFILRKCTFSFNDSILNYMARLWEQSSQSNLPTFTCLNGFLGLSMPIMVLNLTLLLDLLMTVSFYGTTRKRASYCLLTT